MKKNVHVSKEDLATYITIVCSPLSIILQQSWQIGLLISVLLFAIAYFIHSKQQLSKKCKMFENTQKLGYPTATMQYLVKQKKRKEFNRYLIQEAHIKYEFSSIIPGRYVHQKIEYRFFGSNISRRSIMSHIMNVSKSVFSDFSHVEITAFDNREGKPLRVEYRERDRNLQLIEVLFLDSGIKRGDAFDFSITLEWHDPQSVDTYDYLIIDPRNYSLEVKEICIEMKTNEERFHKAVKKLLEVDKDTMDYEVIRNLATTIDDTGKIYLKNRFEPTTNKIYLLQLKMRSAKEAAKV